MKKPAVVTILKLLLIFLSLTAMLLIGLYFSLPTILSPQIAQLIEDNTGRKASLTASLHLLPLSLDVHDFVLHETNGDILLSADHFFIDIDAWRSLQQSALIIQEVSLTKPTVHIFRDEKGEINFGQLIPKTPEKTVDSGIFPINVEKIVVVDGAVSWQDLSATKKFSESINALQLTAQNLSTYGDKSGAIQLHFSLQSGGNAHLSASVFANPPSANGQIQLNHLNLASILAAHGSDSGIKTVNADNKLEIDYQLTYALNSIKAAIPRFLLELHDIEYASTGTVAKLAGVKQEAAFDFSYDHGKWRLDSKTAKTTLDNLRIQDKLLAKLDQISFASQITVNANDKSMDVELLNADIDGKGLHLSDQEKNLGTLPIFAIKGISLNLGKRDVKIKQISLQNAEIHTWINNDGTLFYQSFLPSSEKSVHQDYIASLPSWRFGVDQISLKNGALNFENRSLPKSSSLTVNAIDFALNNYTNQEAGDLPIEFSAKLNQNGLLALKGTTALAPFRINLTMAVKNIELENFQAYFDQFIRLDIIDGKINAEGNLLVRQNSPESMDVVFHGGSQIQDMLIRDQRVHKDLLKWQNLSLKNLAVDVLSQRYTADELIINQPYARVTIRKDKTINYSNLFIAKENEKVSSPNVQGNKPEIKQPYFKLGKIKVIDGSSDFTDLSLVLPFSAHIKSLDGGASGVSADENSQILVDLKGNAYDLAPVDISGKVSPFLGQYETKVNFTGLPMPLVSSYMVQFAGYKVEKGKMTLNLDYKIADKKLIASNHFLIDQFELGDRIQHPDAVSLPIKLAVALLKDANGKIKIDVPVTGDLDNPQFNIGTIVGDALINAITKIISSPFSALALLRGEGESNLSDIQFKPGSAALESSEQTKLQQIAVALKARSGLMLEIKGVTQQEQDWPAISDDALYDQLKIRRSVEINLHAKQKIRAEYVELSKADFERLLADMFIEKFPLLGERSLLGIPQLRNPKIGLQFYEVAKQKLQDYIKPEQERMKELANDRAQAIAKFLVQQGGISQERIYILDSVVSDEKQNKSINCLLSLKVN